MQVGELTSNGIADPTRSSYSDSIVTRNWNFNPNQPPQAFRWDTAYGITRGQFGGPGYDPVSPVSQGMEGADGRYTVRDGDTLQSIAASFWGDASLWYLLAEANGLSGNSAGRCGHGGTAGPAAAPRSPNWRVLRRTAPRPCA